MKSNVTKKEFFYDIKQIKTKSFVRVEDSYDYALLDRLRSDCEYFLNHGQGHEKHLWAGDVKSHIAAMKKLYNRLSVKPEWINMSKINDYEQQMLNYKTNSKKIKDRGSHYYLITGLDEGEPIEPYSIDTEKEDLDYHLREYGDMSRSYQPITYEQYLKYPHVYNIYEDYEEEEEEEEDNYYNKNNFIKENYNDLKYYFNEYRDEFYDNKNEYIETFKAYSLRDLKDMIEELEDRSSIEEYRR